ncbi:MAG: site-specific integrase [Lachnospiraceae bacterium]|nr:site-specific integrase [Lachnospiraceae bacterium]
MGKDLSGKELGEGIIQRKNGRYEARFVDRFGKRISFSGKDLKDVKKRYNEAIYENEKEINIKKDIKLDKWYKEWMNVYKYDVIRENTKRHYNQVYAKHISPKLGNFNLTSITQVQIKRLLKDLDKQGYGYETKNKVRILLVDIFNKALINEYVKKNPAKGITIKRNDSVERRVLSQEEQSVFFDCCKGTFYDNFFVTAVTTGMRIGELAALRWKDIDWNKNVIHVTRTLVYQKFDDDDKKEFHLGDPKTQTSIRDIPISRQCEIALKKQYIQKKAVENKMPVTKDVDKQFKDLLFTTRFNTPLNSQIISDAIDKIISEINMTRDYLDEMETFSAHCLRHTFATRCFESGIQPKTVQSYLGHASLQMTMDLYTSVMPKQMISEMDKVSNAMDKIAIIGDEIVETKFDAINNVKKLPIRDDSMVV